MHPLDCRQRFHSLLTEQSLDPDHLDPWSGWRTFKAFLRQEVFGVYDAAAVQIQHEGNQPVLFLVRQFTTRQPDRDGSDDELVGRLVVELTFPPGYCAEQDVWTLDFPSLEEWASVVEGLPAFQTLLNREPVASSVYYETGPD